MSILLVILLIFVLRVVFEIPAYAIVLGIIGIIALICAVSVIDAKYQKRIADSIESAELIEEVAVYTKRDEYAGYSVTWHEKRIHYAPKDVLDHYKCVFSVTYKDGRRAEVICKKGSVLYNELIKKSNFDN